MYSQLSERIRSCQASFSKGQRLIAKYIEENPADVAFITASKLGATVGVSESTVVRFATELGYSGYPALQQGMQEMVRNKLTSYQRLEMTYRNVEQEKLLSAVLEQDIGILKRTRDRVNQEGFYGAAKALVPAKKVYLLGAGSSLALATFLAHYFELIFDSVQLVEATSEAKIYQQMLHIGPSDAVVAISFPRYSKKAVHAMRYAADRGAVTVAITDTEASPMAKHAAHAVLARSDMVSFVDSLVGPLSLINALIVTVAIEKHDEVSSTLQQVEEIWEANAIYEKVEEEKTEDVTAHEKG